MEGTARCFKSFETAMNAIPMMYAPFFLIWKYMIGLLLSHDGGGAKFSNFFRKTTTLNIRYVSKYFIVKVRLPELAFLRLTVVDVATGVPTATRVLPLNKLRPGREVVKEVPTATRVLPLNKLRPGGEVVKEVPTATWVLPLSKLIPGIEVV